MTQMNDRKIKFIDENTIWFMASLDDRILTVKLDTFDGENGSDLFSHFQFANGNQFLRAFSATETYLVRVSFGTCQGDGIVSLGSF